MYLEVIIYIFGIGNKLLVNIRDCLNIGGFVNYYHTYIQSYGQC